MTAELSPGCGGSPRHSERGSAEGSETGREADVQTDGA